MSRVEAGANLFARILKRMGDQQSLEQATEQVTTRAGPVPVTEPDLENLAPDLGGESVSGPELFRPVDAPEPDAPAPDKQLVGETLTPDETAEVVGNIGAQVEPEDMFSNLNDARIESKDDLIGFVEGMAKVSEARGEGLDPGTTFKEVEKGSKEVTWKSIVAKWKAGENLDKFELRRAREVQVSLLDGLQAKAGKLLEKSRNGGLTAEDEYQFRVSLTKMSAINNLVGNEKRRIGQELAVLRDTVTSNPAIRNMQREHFLDTVGVQTDFDTILKSIEAAPDAKTVGDIIYGKGVRRIARIAGNAWYNAVLAKFAVGKAALGGLTINKFLFPMETLVASGVSKIRQTFPNQNLTEGLESQVRAGEAIIEISGFFQGFKDALSPLMKQIKDPDFELGPMKFERAKPTDTMMRGIDPDKEFSLSPKGIFGGVAPENGDYTKGMVARDVGFQVIDAVTQNGSRRAMMMSDYITRSVTFQQKTKAMAYRIAANEGLDGDALVDRMNEVMRDMPDDVFNAAIHESKVATMTQKLWDSSRKVEDMVAGTVGLRYFAPFTRTMLAMFQAGYERTPGIGILSKSAQEAWAKGGATRDMMVAKQVVGLGVMGMGSMMAMSGEATSGMYLSKDEQSSRMKSGWRPNSVLVNGEWYSFQFASPIFEVFNLGVSLYEISHYMNEGISPTDPRHKEWGDAIATTAMTSAWTFADVWLNKSIGRGMMELLEALDDPAVYGQAKGVSVIAPVFQGAGTAHVRRQIDPTRRRLPESGMMTELIDTIRDQLPGLSEHLPPAIGYFGEERPPYSLMDGFSMSPVDPNAGIFEEMFVNGIKARMPANTVTFPDGSQINLDLDVTPEMLRDEARLPGWDEQDVAEYGKRGFMYYRYSKIRGGLYQQQLEALIRTPEYKSDAVPYGEPTNTDAALTKGELIRQVMEGVNEVAKIMLVDELSQLMKEDITDYLGARRAEVGAVTSAFPDLGLTQGRETQEAQRATEAQETIRQMNEAPQL